MRPSRFQAQPLSVHRAQRRRLGRGDRGNPHHLHDARCIADKKRCDYRRRHRIRKWCGRRLNDLKTTKPQILQQKGSNETSIIHIQPFGRSDEATEVSWRCMQRRGKKKICVQTGQLACRNPSLRRVPNQPCLPFWFNQVMPDIRRIADIKRPSLNALDLGAPVIGQQYRCSFRHASGRQVGAAQQGGNGIPFNGEQRRARNSASGFNDEPP